MFLWAGYCSSHQTGRFSTGILIAGVTSLLGLTVFFISAAITRPSLLLAPFENPFMFVIVGVLMAIALGFGIAAGTAGAAAGRWLPPRPKTVRIS